RGGGLPAPGRPPNHLIAALRMRPLPSYSHAHVGTVVVMLEARTARRAAGLGGSTGAASVPISVPACGSDFGASATGAAGMLAAAGVGADFCTALGVTSE